MSYEKNKQIAANALKFLERVNLTGAEVQAFLEVNQMLGSIVAEKAYVNADPDLGQRSLSLVELPSQ